MNAEQQKKAVDLLLNVLYAHSGGHLDARTEDGERILDDIRKFLFTELKIKGAV